MPSTGKGIGSDNRDGIAASRVAYCPTCDRAVEIVLAMPPLHGGQATLADDVEVCLDFSQPCTATTCPLFGTPPAVVAARLARSGLGDGRMPTHVAQCEGCGQIVNMQEIDDVHGICPVCRSAN